MCALAQNRARMPGMASEGVRGRERENTQNRAIARLAEIGHAQNFHHSVRTDE